MKSQRIIFISLIQINSLSDRGIYHDLLREFVKNGHEVTVVCPVERRTGLVTRFFKENNVSILQVRTLNIQKSSIYEKGLATVSLNLLLQRAIKKFLSTSTFDLILYSTPPITLTGLISWLKKRDGAKTYLLLKDIFPQNAVDMGIFSDTSALHAYFKRKERILYEHSDRIGCMSPANLQYICERHPKLAFKLEENPNSVDLTRVSSNDVNRGQVLKKWDIPVDAVIYLYGGNLGKPQGTMYLISLISAAKKFPNSFFLIIGDGTDYPSLKEWFDQNQPINAKLIQLLPRPSFDELAACCDVGLILLRREFTIPNFPSRLLTYMENKMPVLAITDIVCDVGPIAEKAGFGKWCLYGDIEAALKQVSYFTNNAEVRAKMGEAAFKYLNDYYDVRISYNKIIKFV